MIFFNHNVTTLLRHLFLLTNLSIHHVLLIIFMLDSMTSMFYYFPLSGIMFDITSNLTFKVRTIARTDTQNKSHVRGLMFLYLLIFKIHVTKHANT